jgi:hypothetical protein
MHAMKTCGRMEAYLHLFLTLSLNGMSGQLGAQATLPVEEIYLSGRLGGR